MPQSLAEQLKSIAMSPTLGATLDRAHAFAREQTHRAVLLEHVLLALLEDADAVSVLRASNVDLVRLGTDVSGYLGRLPEDMRTATGAEPRPDPELLRVLHAAGQAAQQSRRRQIDGAIVLAAIVGDAKSPSAGLLKTNGLTFEEAIRALQRANAQARSKQFATPAMRAPTPTPAPAEPSAPDPTPSPSPAAEAPTPPDAAGRTSGQTVEEILAAARARIQQRTAAMVGKPDAAADEPPPAAPDMPALSSLGPVTAPSAPPPFSDPTASEDGAPAAPSPPPVQQAPPAPPSWTPPPSQPVADAVQPGTPHAFQHRQRPPAPPAGDGGVRRPPLPHRAGQHAGFPHRPPRAPWPDSAEPPPPPLPPMAANGARTGARQPGADIMGAAPRPAPNRPGQRPAGGPLVETIPRRMRAGVPAIAQVRISRDKIDGLIQLLLGVRGTARRPDALLTRALSVRLKAPDGGFWIEANSPETQWVETAPGLQQDDHASWRWVVTPHRRGRHRLLLVVTARTVGRDGLPAETAPPDRVIEVAVKGNYRQGAVRWAGLAAAGLLGAVVTRFGAELWALAAAAIRRLAGG
jgi:hypothetical protein